MKYLLAIDQGTTSSRAILFDRECRLVSVAQQELPQYFPRPGWVEHEPEEIWRTQFGTIREALARAGISSKDVAAIGITNQRETTLVWDRTTAAPLHRAIVWQDRRTADFTDRLRQNGLEPGIREKTGLVLDPYFSASKLAWLLEHVPGLRARAADGEVCFGTVDAWLMYRLSGGRIYATDVTNASRTQLFDIRDLAWDAELLDVFGIPRAMLPEVKPSSGSFGETDPGLFGHSMEIAAAAGDQQAALFGQACFEPGMAKNTYGTGAFVVMNTGRSPMFADGVLTTLAWRIGKAPPVYALEGSIFVAGAAVQWLRDGLGLIRRAGEVEELARSVPDSEGVYFVPALTGLGAPWWDPHARGLIIGLTRGSTKAHVARAALEAMAYQTADVIDVMQSAGGVRLRELRADGGAAANDLLLQFQADVLGTPVLRPRGTEGSALGAALLAGLGVGLLDLETIADSWAIERRCDPQMDRQVVCRLRDGWRRAVERSRGWADPDGPR